VKELEGREVYLYPTGNNARGKISIKKALIVKVARVNVTYLLDGWARSIKERYQGFYIDSGCNSGYRVYESMKQIDDLMLSRDIAKSLSRKLNYSSDFERLGLEKLKLISDIVGIDFDNKD